MLSSFKKNLQKTMIKHKTSPDLIMRESFSYFIVLFLIFAFITKGNSKSISIHIEIEGYNLMDTKCFLGRYIKNNYFIVDTITIDKFNKIITSIPSKKSSGYYRVYCSSVDAFIPFMIEEEMDDSISLKAVFENKSVSEINVIHSRALLLFEAQKAQLDTFLLNYPNSFWALTHSISQTLSDSPINYLEAIKVLPFKDERLINIPLFNSFIDYYLNENHENIKNLLFLLEQASINKHTMTFLYLEMLKKYREDKNSENYCILIREFNNKVLDTHKAKIIDFCN